MVAGLAVLLRAWYPSLSNDETQQIIEDSADDIDSLNPGREGMLGAGRINASACFLTEVVDSPARSLPFALSQSYPNPFNASTAVQYSLPEAARVVVEIYDILGRKIETLVSGQQQAGYHQVIREARVVSSGMYFHRIQAGEYAEINKMILVK